MKNLKSEIKKFVLDSGKFSHNKAKSVILKNVELHEQLIARTSYLAEDVKISERCYHIINDITQSPTCAMCLGKTEYFNGTYSKTCKNTICHTTLRIQLAAKTMKEKGIYERVGKEHKIRMRDASMKLKHSKAISKALNTPDENGILPKNKAAESLIYTLKFNPEIHKLREPKRRKTMEEAGRWIPLDQLDEAVAYRLKIHAVTMSQPLQQLDNFEKRGPSSSDSTLDNYHIDHIFSVIDGFRFNIPPEIIGHISNLRMIHHRENVKKGGKSDITLDELYSRYYACI